MNFDVVIRFRPSDHTHPLIMLSLIVSGEGMGRVVHVCVEKEVCVALALCMSKCRSQSRNIAMMDPMI